MVIPTPFLPNNIHKPFINIRWRDIVYTFGLKQLISQPTRITKSSETIIDHFCTNRVDLISEVKVSDYSVSDYFSTACTYKLNNVKAKENNTIVYIIGVSNQLILNLTMIYNAKI